MATTAADVLVKGLIDRGVDTVFGIPGDGINGIVEAMRQRQNEIRFIQGRHEESAAPYANAAAQAYPDRPVVALVGDGGLSMLMAELATSAKYDLNVKIIVLKN